MSQPGPIIHKQQRTLWNKTKRGFRRLMGKNPSGNTKKSSNTQGFNTTTPGTAPQRILPNTRRNPFNNNTKPTEERIKLFDDYEFVIDTENSVVINLLNAYGNVQRSAISVNEISSPDKFRDTGNTPGLIKQRLTTLKGLFPTEEGKRELEIVNRDDNSNGYKYNFDSPGFIYPIKEHIHNLNFLANKPINYTGPIPEYKEKTSNKAPSSTPVPLLNMLPEIEPAPAKKKSGFRSRATKRIKKARNVLVSGVKHAGRGIVYGAKWIGTQTKKRLTALTGFFTNIFSKFDNTAERQASEFKEESYVHVGQEEVQQAGVPYRSQHVQPKPSLLQIRNNLLTENKLATKMRTFPADGAVSVENVAQINLYNKFVLKIIHNNTGEEDYEFTIYLKDNPDKAISWDTFKTGVTALVDIEGTVTQINNELDPLAETFKVIGSPQAPKYQFKPSTYDKNNLAIFSKHIRAIGIIIDEYNKLINTTGTWTKKPFGNENQMKTNL